MFAFPRLYLGKRKRDRNDKCLRIDNNNHLSMTGGVDVHHTLGSAS
jgi:hypothetical protein